MAVTDWPWPSSALPGQNPGESQGDLVNAYAVKIGDIVKIRRTPGLSLYRDVSALAGVKPRGMHSTASHLFHLWGGILHVQTVSGLDSVYGNSIAGTGRVTYATNLREPLGDTVIVSDVGAYYVNHGSTSVLPYPDADLGPVTSVEYYAGYFFFTQASGKIVASDLQNMDIDPLSIARAEYSADTLLRTKSTGSMLLAMGSQTCEAWVDVGSSPFPCTRQFTLDVGLLGKWAVAGGANEWEHGLIWVASDYTVRKLDGVKPLLVSNDDVAKDIYQYRDRPDEIVAQVYGFEQQAVWSITTPEWTWEFNVASGAWHRRDSYGYPHWRATSSTLFKNHWYAQDLHVHRLMQIEQGVYREIDDRLRFRVESGPMKAFPATIRVPSSHVDITVGLGKDNVPSPSETDPAGMFSWSHDGGANWGNPIARSLGKVGRYSTLVRLPAMGRSTHHGTMLRLDITDPVPVVLTRAVSTQTRVSRVRQVRV